MNKFQKGFYIIGYFLGTLFCIAGFFLVDAPSIGSRLGRLLLTLILFNGLIYVGHQAHKKIAHLTKNNRM
ncbi:hypothetical protein [Psychrobacillus vulpis]|uniref:Uncharacterized protein n=1 Tax=Psychrobacillus vulpis TaxID=2325572 RepID=A0A544TSU0_9BACI|nr:hypothetical protein [Psychrobacillus vulpis]TQR20513.1 hypothetical protein FG384_07080 [Psychrobacillus vulpis]